MVKSNKAPRKAVQWLDDHMNSQSEDRASPPQKNFLDEQGIDPNPFNELTSALERHQSESESQSHPQTQTQSTPTTRIHYFPPRPDTRGGRPVSLSVQTNVSNSANAPGPISLDEGPSTSTSTNPTTTASSSPTSASHLHGDSERPPFLNSEPLLHRSSSGRRRHQEHEQHYGPSSTSTNGTHTVLGEAFIDSEESAGLPGVDLEGMAKRRATMIVKAHTRGRRMGIGRGMMGGRGHGAMSSGNTTEDEGDMMDDGGLKENRHREKVGGTKEGAGGGRGFSSFFSSFRRRRNGNSHLDADAYTNANSHPGSSSRSRIESGTVHSEGAPHEIKSRDYGYGSGPGYPSTPGEASDVDLESLSGHGHTGAGSIPGRIPAGGGVLSALLALYGQGQGQGQGHPLGSYASGYEGTLGPGSIASSAVSTPATTPGIDLELESHEGYFDRDHHAHDHDRDRGRGRGRGRGREGSRGRERSRGRGRDRDHERDRDRREQEETAYNTAANAYSGYGAGFEDANGFGHALEPSDSQTTAVNPDSQPHSPSPSWSPGGGFRRKVPGFFSPSASRAGSRTASPARQQQGRQAPPRAISALIASTGNIGGAASPGAASIGPNLSLMRRGKRVLAGLKAKTDWGLSRYSYSGDGPLPAQEDDGDGQAYDEKMRHKASKSVGDLRDLGAGEGEIELESMHSDRTTRPEMIRHSSSHGTSSSGTGGGTRDTNTNTNTSSSSSGMGTGTGSDPEGYATPADIDITNFEPGGHLNRNIGGMRLDLSGHQPKTLPAQGQAQRMSNPVSQYISPLSSGPASSRLGPGQTPSASVPGTPSFGAKKDRSSRWSEVFSSSMPSLQLPLPLPSPGGLLRSGRSTPMSGETSVSLEGEKWEKGGYSKEREREREREKERERERKERKKRKKAEIYITRHVAQIIQRQEFLMKLVRAMMMFGAPAHRLQAQIKATAHVLDVDISCMYLPDVFLISFDDASTGTSLIKFIRQGSALDLGKLRDAYSVYWKVIHDDISVSSASKTLDNLMRSPPYYSPWQLMIFGGLCSSSICSVSFNGSFLDSLVVFPLGCFLVFMQILSVRNELYSNVFEITITTLFSFVCGALAATRHICYSAITSSSIVLILPGFIVLSGALEVLSRNIVSGSVRMCYAVVYCLFLGFGLAMGAQAYERFVGHEIVGLTDTSCTVSHRGDLGWWQQQPSGWWAFLTVPMFSLFLSLRNQAPIWRKETVLLVGIACIGWVVNHFTSLRFTSQSDIVAAFGAFAVGFVANMYARFLRGNAFVIMITGILFQVPSGLGQNGLLVFVSQQSSGSSTSYISGFQTSLQLISVAIGLTVGLGIALFLAHPIPSRRRAAGVFSL